MGSSLILLMKDLIGGELDGGLAYAYYCSVGMGIDRDILEARGM